MKVFLAIILFAFTVLSFAAAGVAAMQQVAPVPNTEITAE